MTARCETCKHWLADESDWAFEEYFEEYGVRICQSITMGLTLRSARAFVVDGGCCFAPLLTRPDFGCVLHEPIPDTDTREG